MAFPTLVGTNQGASAAVNTTTHTPTIINGNVGDLILVILALSTNTTITKPSGWNASFQYDYSTGVITHVGLWKIATNVSETISVTSTASCQSTFITYRFSGAAWVTTNGATAASSLTPTSHGGRAADIAKDCTWVEAIVVGSSVTPTATPAGFSSLISQLPSGTSPAVHSVTQNLNSDSMTGGNWTFAAATTSVGACYCVEPSRPWARAYLVGMQSDSYSTNSNHTTLFRYMRYGAATDTQANDVVLACFTTSAIGQAQRNVTITTPGYTLLSNAFSAGANFSIHQMVYYKVLTSSDTSIQWTSDGVSLESVRLQYNILRPPSGSERFTVTSPNNVSSNTTLLPDPPLINVPDNTASQQIMYWGSHVGNGSSTSGGFTFNSAADYWFGAWSGAITTAGGTALLGEMMHVRFDGRTTVPLDPQPWTVGLSNTTGGAMATSSALISISGGNFKVADNTGSFAPHTLKYWSGSYWRTKPILYWNGSTWARANT